MLNPSRSVVITLTLVALVSLVLGLATDVGLFGWTLAVLLALYLAIAGTSHLLRSRSSSVRGPA